MRYQWSGSITRFAKSEFLEKGEHFMPADAAGPQETRFIEEWRALNMDALCAEANAAGLDVMINVTWPTVGYAGGPMLPDHLISVTIFFPAHHYMASLSDAAKIISNHTRGTENTLEVNAALNGRRRVDQFRNLNELAA